jgi:hypothetical protein
MKDIENMNNISSNSSSSKEDENKDEVNSIKNMDFNKNFFGNDEIKDNIINKKEEEKKLSDSVKSIENRKSNTDTSSDFDDDEDSFELIRKESSKSFLTNSSDSFDDDVKQSKNNNPNINSSGQKNINNLSVRDYQCENNINQEKNLISGASNTKPEKNDSLFKIFEDNNKNWKIKKNGNDMTDKLTAFKLFETLYYILRENKNKLNDYTITHQDEPLKYSTFELFMKLIEFFKIKQNEINAKALKQNLQTQIKFNQNQIQYQSQNQYYNPVINYMFGGNINLNNNPDSFGFNV